MELLMMYRNLVYQALNNLIIAKDDEEIELAIFDCYHTLGQLINHKKAIDELEELKQVFVRPELTIEDIKDWIDEAHSCCDRAYYAVYDGLAIEENLHKHLRDQAPIKPGEKET